MINVASHPVPTKSNPLGAKGCGEAGTSGGLPSVANAVIDALSDYGIRHLEMPMTPARIWQAIRRKPRSSNRREKQSGATVSRWPRRNSQDCDQTGPGSFMFLSGIDRTRVPVAAKIALATAGAVAAVPGSPMPPHFLPPDSAR